MSNTFYYLSKTDFEEMKKKTKKKFSEEIKKYEVIGTYLVSDIREYLVNERGIKENKVEELIEDLKEMYIHKYEETVGNDIELEYLLDFYIDRYGKDSWDFFKK